jgi:Flp pilus assembly protein protease CpaA
MSALNAALLLTLLALAAWFDLRRRCIPNALPSAVAVLWLVAAAQGPAAPAIAEVATGAALLAAGIVVWRLG